jgi:hypothetical protein
LHKTLKVFYSSGGRYIDAAKAVSMTYANALRVWTDDVRGTKGSYYGLIDDSDRTLQFYFISGIPNHIDDAGSLRIVEMDIPEPIRQGSYISLVKICEVSNFIKLAFDKGISAGVHRFVFRKW